VKLYSATISSGKISFNLLRRTDGSRVKQPYIAVNDGKLVERSEMVKGYEFAKDQYVMFNAEEIKALEDSTSTAIDISQFVPLESVDPVFFDGTYYLAPDKGGRQAVHSTYYGASQSRAVRNRALDLPRQGAHCGDPAD
jgi:DNA end-binding protein Ku